MKKQYALLFAAIVILSIYLAFRKTDNVNYELPALPGVLKKDITAIEMENKAHRLVLKKDGETWRIDPDKYLAAADRVDRILDALETFTLTAMVSQAKSYDRFDLTNDKKISVKVFSGEKRIYDFDMGCIAGTHQHTFVRIAGDDRVYHARGNLQNRFTANIDEVRDKTVMMFNPHEIREVRLGYSDQFLSIARVTVPESQAGDAASGEAGPDKGKSRLRQKEISWERADGQPVDEAALDRLLSSVSELKCEKYIYHREKDAFRDPRYSIAFIGARAYSLIFYPQEKENPDAFPAVSSESKSPFVLHQYKADELIAGIEAMMGITQTNP